MSIYKVFSGKEELKKIGNNAKEIKQYNDGIQPRLIKGLQDIKDNYNDPSKKITPFTDLFEGAYNSNKRIDSIIYDAIKINKKRIIALATATILGTTLLAGGLGLGIYSYYQTPKAPIKKEMPISTEYYSEFLTKKGWEEQPDETTKKGRYVILPGRMGDDSKEYFVEFELEAYNKIERIKRNIEKYEESRNGMRGYNELEATQMRDMLDKLAENDNTITDKEATEQIEKSKQGLEYFLK